MIENKNLFSYLLKYIQHNKGQGNHLEQGVQRTTTPLSP